MTFAHPADQDAWSAAEPARLLGAWMAAVVDVVRAVNAAEPLDDILDRIAEQACRLIGFDYCAVMLAESTSRWLMVHGSHRLSRSYVSILNHENPIVISPASRRDDTVAARAFRDGTTVSMPDIAEAQDYGATQRWAVEQGFGGLLVAPLLSTGRAAGVVVAYSRTARDFTRSEVSLVELLAQHAVLALETAELRSVQDKTISELKQKRRLLERAELQHRQLMQLLLDEAGLQRLSEALAESLEVSIMIEDADDNVLAFASTAIHQRPPTARWRRRAGVRDALRRVHERYEVVLIDPEGSEAGGWIAPVVLGRQMVGRVWGTGVSDAPGPAECRVIERFALVVAVELLKRRYRLDTENRLVGDLLAELMRTDPTNIPQSTVERASLLGHDLSKPQMVAVVCGPLRPGDVVETARAADSRVPRPLVGVHAGELVVVLPADPDPIPTLEALTTRIAAVSRGESVTTVLGPVVTSRFSEALATTLGAWRLCTTHSRGPVLDFRDLGLTAHLLRTGTAESLGTLADALLVRLEEHDRRGGAQLCDTLRSWLAHGCSVPAAARAMTVHPNTVSYRLRKAEDVLDRSLKAMASKMELQIAFTIRDVQHALTPSTTTL